MTNYDLTTQFFKKLIHEDFIIQAASCGCGGNYAWMRPSDSDLLSYIMVGCICHNSPQEIMRKYVKPDNEFGGEQIARDTYLKKIAVWSNPDGEIIDYKELSGGVKIEFKIERGKLIVHDALPKELFEI